MLFQHLGQGCEGRGGARGCLAGHNGHSVEWTLCVQGLGHFHWIHHLAHGDLDARDLFAQGLGHRGKTLGESAVDQRQHPVAYPKQRGFHNRRAAGGVHCDCGG